jgi:hypothetical protein
MREKNEFTMLDSSPERTPGKTLVSEDAQAQDLQRRRRKRHRAQQQKRLERLQRKALIVFLYVLTIGLVLAAWYGLLKS